jgi:hypothetical protein
MAGHDFSAATCYFAECFDQTSCGRSWRRDDFGRPRGESLARREWCKEGGKRARERKESRVCVCVCVCVCTRMCDEDISGRAVFMIGFNVWATKFVDMSRQVEPFTIPEGHCWVLADNEALSPPDVVDSRLTSDGHNRLRQALIYKGFSFDMRYTSALAKKQFRCKQDNQLTRYVHGAEGLPMTKPCRQRSGLYAYYVIVIL